MKIIIGVTASVSIYKTCEIIRLFRKNNDDIYVVMTENSTKLISPVLFETISNNPVYIDTFSERNSMTHISLKENADLMIVAPADANIIGKYASGIADDLLSTTLISVSCPVLLAPAMNPNMWSNFSVKKNVNFLRNNNVHFIGPVSGDVICGENGIGKLSSPEEIYNAAKKIIGL